MSISVQYFIFHFFGLLRFAISLFKAVLVLSPPAGVIENVLDMFAQQG